ncbi:MAG: sulfite exporter TauE/SafE family protein [Candidatus Peregrinibacteria bacterium]
MSASPTKTLKLRISGMHCGSCEILLERKFKNLSGVQSSRLNYRKGTAYLEVDPSNVPSQETIQAILSAAHYSLVSIDGINVESTPSESTDPRSVSPQWLHIGGALLIIFALYKLLQTFDLLSLAPSTSGALTYGGVFVIGLVAGSSSCLAVTGGLLLSMAATYHEAHRSATTMQKLQPLLQFNVGRVIGYTLLGGVVGFLGQSITLTPTITAGMSIAVALIMLYLALSILHIIPKDSFPIRPPKALSHWIADLSQNRNPVAPFVLGALTFFLPCGFTQSLQATALASGSPVSGALIMGTFALGTMPALIGISAITSSAKGSFSKYFLTFAGSLVLVLSLFNLQSGLALAGVDVRLPFDAQSPVADTLPTPTPTNVPNPNPRSKTLPPTASVQEVSMAVTSYGYQPSDLTITAGTPVRFHVDGTNARGCTQGFTIPSLGIQKVLAAGDNVFEFTPTSPGRIPFSCSMGMVRGSFTVLPAPEAPTAQVPPSPPAPEATPPAAAAAPTVQDISMAVNSYGYEPSELTIKAGVPVRFHVDGTNARGCTQGFTIPSLGIQKVLAAGDNVFEFTPTSAGRIPFSCSMGMVRGAFTVE